LRPDALDLDDPSDPGAGLAARAACSRLIAAVSAALLLAGLATACTTASTAGDEPDAADANAYEDQEDDAEEALLYTCTPFVGAPHEAIRIYAVDPGGQAKATPGGSAPSPAASPSAKNDKTGKSSKNDQGGAAGVPVLIELNNVEDGVHGRCRTEPAAAAAGAAARYACSAADGSIRMRWPAGAEPPAKADVDVDEKWLLGTRSYRAACVREP
jgi:hypothetical protein